MHLNAYLTFNGQCEAAFKFYEQCLGGKIVAMFTHAGTPAASQVPPEWQGKIMHATLNCGQPRTMAPCAVLARSEWWRGAGLHREFPM